MEPLRFRTIATVLAAPLVAGAVVGSDGQFQVSEPQELSIPLAV
jgi:hypothetical protein